MSSQTNPATQQPGMPPALPGNAAAQVMSAVGAKRGRLPNLARFYHEQDAELQMPIYPLNYCRHNDPDWFKRTQQLVLDLRDGIKRPNSTLTPQMVAHVDANIAKIEMLPIGNQFKTEPRSKRKLPDLQVTGVRRERAIEISEALLTVTKLDPCKVRHAALGYLYAVDDRMQVRLTGREYAPYGRVLLSLVDRVAERLHSPSLCWRLKGIEVDKERKDPRGWFRDLILEPSKIPTDIPFTSPKTPHNTAELDHILIDVCFAGGKNRVSREFHEVMLFAAVTELWKCVGA
jgi:hypothetical protein